jgi:hypothetical protein
MAKSLTTIGDLLITNATNVAAQCSSTNAEITAVGQFLKAAARYPGAFAPVGNLIRNPELKPD